MGGEIIDAAGTREWHTRTKCNSFPVPCFLLTIICKLPDQREESAVATDHGHTADTDVEGLRGENQSRSSKKTRRQLTLPAV